MNTHKLKLHLDVLYTLVGPNHWKYKVAYAKYERALHAYEEAQKALIAKHKRMSQS
jgi:hypothetical protein